MNGFVAAAIVLLAMPQAAWAGDCLALASGAWPNTAIDRVEQVAGGTVRLFGAGNLPSGAAPSADHVDFLPGHCLVRGVIGRRPSIIAGNTLGNGFELRMPDDWNGRFFFQGGGGWDGWLRQASGVIVSGTADQASALARGFAVVSTDAGHLSDQASAPTDGRFGADMQARSDNAVDAVKQTTAVAKQIVARYYGRPIVHSYFVGCSNGGREGMIEAQQEPGAYDGIVSGDPAFDLTRAAIAWDWNERALTEIAPRDAAGRPELWKALDDADLGLLSDATARKCGEALPGQCSFDVATLQCQAGATAACLTPAKITAIQKIQRGPSDSAGHALYSPWTQGGEAGPAGWRAWMLGTDKAPGRARAFVEDWMRYVAVLPGQKPIDWARFDYDSDPARIAGPTAAWQADGTDYSAFARRGGRILFYQGTADPAFSAIHLMRNLEHVPDAASFSRLFLVPGMAHCSGGQAFDRFDPLSAIVDWVEKGQAPSRMIATGAAFPGAAQRSARSAPTAPAPDMALCGPLSLWQAEDSAEGLLRVTVGDLLDRQAGAYPDGEALVFSDEAGGKLRRWSFATLRGEAEALARGLMALGLVRGDHVAVLAPNGPEWILLEFALAKIGAVLVTVNTAYRQIELGYLLRQSRARALFTAVGFRGHDYLASVRALLAEGTVPDLQHVVTIAGRAVDMLAFDDLATRGGTVSPDALAQRQASVQPDDIAQIQYTSGTTGAPKGVMLTHAGIVANARLMGDRALWTRHDRLLGVMPLFHTAGCVCNVLGMMTRGGTLVLMESFDAARALALLVSERITVMNGVPTMYLRLLAEPGVREGRFREASVLHTAFAGGTNIPPTVMRQMQEAFGAAPMLIMGMTEASPIITQTLPTGSFAENTGSAGIPLPHTAIKVIDPLSGELVRLGVQGELCIRGYGVTPGYFAMPERTAEAIDAEGWLHSGDLAVLDAEGRLRIVGRTKDMIIRGGENIYPAEIEELLMHHPGVEQVQVVGVPDAEFGEEAFAFVIARDAALTEAELRAYARASFSRHKVPRYMMFVEGFPQTASGKVQKFELRVKAREVVGG